MEGIMNRTDLGAEHFDRALALAAGKLLGGFCGLGRPPDATPSDVAPTLLASDNAGQHFQAQINQQTAQLRWSAAERRL
jgi:hypothetical protein